VLIACRWLLAGVDAIYIWPQVDRGISHLTVRAVLRPRPALVVIGAWVGTHKRHVIGA